MSLEPVTRLSFFRQFSTCLGRSAGRRSDLQNLKQDLQGFIGEVDKELAKLPKDQTPKSAY